MKRSAIGAGFLVIATGLAACASAQEAELRAEASASASAQLALGRDGFGQCDGCHSIEQDVRSGMGPNLYGIAGRRAGSLPSFPYSEALASSGITWDVASLDAFLADPSGLVPGSEMQRGAVRDPELRAAIVAYLVSAGD